MLLTSAGTLALSPSAGASTPDACVTHQRRRLFLWFSLLQVDVSFIASHPEPIRRSPSGHL